MNKNKKKVLLLGISIVLVIGLLVSVSYAYWKFTASGQANVVVSKCFQLTFLEEENTNIELLNAYPIVDEEGSQLKPYIVRLNNTCDNDLTYQMNLEILPKTTLNEKYVKVMVNENIYLLNTLESGSSNIAGGMKSYVLEEGEILGREEKTLSLRMWIDGSVSADDTESMSKAFYSKVSVIGSIKHYEGRYTESILNGTDPVLANGLIPVKIDEEGTVYKADESREWYSYTNKRWANAVILNDESVVYQNNEVIPESNIESYFVWIPRYRYQIFNDGMYTELSSSINESAVQEIKVEFENKDKVASDGVRKGQWLTHPAFTSFDVNGIWVGKFETGYKGSTDTTSAQVNVNEPESVQIKPNVNSWRNISIANMFYTSYDYKREMDSHMMKNTEWGAVSYLSHSKYGSMSSVRINNNSDYKTGYASVLEPTCGYTGTNEECNRYGNTEDITKPWNTSIGYLASTTGNITGIYDMSGGAWEYVMGVMTDKNGNMLSGRNSLYNSGFNGLFSCPSCDGDTSGLKALTTGKNVPESKYYDTYAYAENDETYNRRILGDATGEMGPFAIATYGTQKRTLTSWYNNQAWHVSTRNPWLDRGAGYESGSESGMSAFGSRFSHASELHSYRVVIAI